MTDKQMNKTTAALKLAEEALGNLIRWMDANKFVVLPKERKNLAAIREALAEQAMVLNDPHPPHRLCECTACLEYWTPLPDCDAFAASGKVIGCAYCDNPLFAGTKCNNCGRVTLAEPVKQEPVSRYAHINLQARAEALEEAANAVRFADNGTEAAEIIRGMK